MDELTQRNEDLQQQLEIAEKNASASVAMATVSATVEASGVTVDGNTDRGMGEEIDRLTRALEELRAGDAT
eukprot:COSAG02_NODE_591_length_19862_cov_8.047918_4_plen_71_part_00